MRRHAAEFGIPDVGKEPEPVKHVVKMTPRRETDTIRLLVRDRLTGRYGTLDINLRSCDRTLATRWQSRRPPCQFP